MAKQALLDVLEQTIGKYVRNLDANSLNLAVWSGKIELHGLELDVDAVNAELDRQAALTPNLAIPFRVTSLRKPHAICAIFQPVLNQTIGRWMYGRTDGFLRP